MIKSLKFSWVKNIEVHSQKILKFNVYNIEVHLKILKTTVSIFETALKPESISKNGQDEKDAQFSYLFNGISFASFRKIV